MTPRIIKASICLIIALAALLYAGEWIARSQRSDQASDYKNISYTIDGNQVVLTDGVASIPSAPGSASQIITKYFGNNATADLNGDELPDTVFILTQNTGGSGTFYYVVAALQTKTGFVGTNGILLGDRIAPQTIEISGTDIVVNFADRSRGEPMTTSPSVAVTKHFHISGTLLVADPRLVGVGEHCGGNMVTANMCSIGLTCEPNPGSHLPFGDVGGICVANSVTPKTGLLNGRVTISPTCPIERMPPDPSCAPRGYTTTIDAIKDQKIIQSIQSLSDGSFSMSLPYGDYLLHAHGINPYPQCSEQSVAIDSASTSISLSCDSGIR